jgi:hypothetical protein
MASYDRVTTNRKTGVSGEPERVYSRTVAAARRTARRRGDLIERNGRDLVITDRNLRWATSYTVVSPRNTSEEAASMDTTQPLAEMHNAIETVIRTFQERCPEGFDASTLAAAIVDACSDEMDRLYGIEEEHGQYRKLLVDEGYMSDPLEGVAAGGTTILPMPTED